MEANERMSHQAGEGEMNGRHAWKHAFPSRIELRMLVHSLRCKVQHCRHCWQPNSQSFTSSRHIFHVCRQDVSDVSVCRKAADILQYFALADFEKLSQAGRAQEDAMTEVLFMQTMLLQFMLMLYTF